MRWLNRAMLVLALGVVAALAVGCARGPRLAAVSGTVRVDNQLLVEGMITFFPTDGNGGPSAGAVITNGTYRIPRAQGAAPGRNRVEIRGFRNTGRKARTHGQLADERVPALGPEYNDNSTLVREVQEGDNVLDFDLPGTGGKKP
jgi:hypothetical protein